MKQKPLLKPPSHRFWLDYNLSKHLPIEFATFLRWESVLTNRKWRKYRKKTMPKPWILFLVFSASAKSKEMMEPNSDDYSTGVDWSWLRSVRFYRTSKKLPSFQNHGHTNGTSIMHTYTYFPFTTSFYVKILYTK